MTALMGSIDRNDPYMKWRRLLLACATLLAASFSAGAASDVADPAVVKIRTFYDTLLTVMQQADKLGIRGRYDKLAPSIHTTFDLAAMTRIAIGPGWNSIAPEQQAALVENFSRMTIATYANRFDSYSGERFEVDATAEPRNNGRIVHTKLFPSTGEPVTLNYLMRSSGDAWNVVDVYLTGTISELATRRSEFSAILNSGGPNALIESLRQQTGKMMRSSSAGPGAGAR